MLDFALVFDRPIIYADVSFDKEPYDAGWLDEEMWILRTLPRIGMQLTEENAERLPELIRESLDSRAFAEGRRQAMAENWVHPGGSIPVIADYLIRVRQRLAEKEGPEHAK